MRAFLLRIAVNWRENVGLPIFPVFSFSSSGGIVIVPFVFAKRKKQRNRQKTKGKKKLNEKEIGIGNWELGIGEIVDISAIQTDE